MIKILNMSYPDSQSAAPAKLAHEDIPLESLVDWYEAPEGLHFTHVDVDEAVDHFNDLDLVHNTHAALGASVLNAIEVHMGRDHHALGYNEKAVHVATIFFVNDDEFRICTQMRSHEALMRITSLASHYISSLSRWMRDPVEDEEHDFLAATKDRIEMIAPYARIDGGIKSLGALG